MSKIALSGDASGTGTFTIASPNSNSNYTLSLPTESGTLTTTASTPTFTGAVTAPSFIPNSSTVPTNGVFLPAANTVGFSTNSTERMRLDSSGNLGLGVTPSAWRTGGGEKVFQFDTGSVYCNSGNDVYVNSNWFLNSSAQNIYLESDFASSYAQASGQHLWYTAPSGTAGNTISFTETARITSGGYFKASNSGAYGDSTGTYHELYQTAAGSQCAIFRASSGSYTSTVLTLQCDRNTTNGTYNFFSASVPGVGTRLVIADSGNVTNVNGSYGTISDAKMKTDIVDAGSQWADIKAIRFRKFKMKDDPSGIVQLGVVAQELEQTSPGLVEEHPDTVEVTKTRTVEVPAVLDEEGNEVTPATTREEEYTENEPTGTTTKSVKTSVMLMKAAVALQEAMARIETLEAKIAALEAKGI